MGSEFMRGPEDGRRVGDGDEGTEDNVQRSKSIWEVVNSIFWWQLRTGLGKAGGKTDELRFWSAGVQYNSRQVTRRR